MITECIVWIIVIQVFFSLSIFLSFRSPWIWIILSFSNDSVLPQYGFTLCKTCKMNEFFFISRLKTQKKLLLDWNALMQWIKSFVLWVEREKKTIEFWESSFTFVLEREGENGAEEAHDELCAQQKIPN